MGDSALRRTHPFEISADEDADRDVLPLRKARTQATLALIASGFDGDLDERGKDRPEGEQREGLLQDDAAAGLAMSAEAIERLRTQKSSAPEEAELPPRPSWLDAIRPSARDVWTAIGDAAPNAPTANDSDSARGDIARLETLLNTVLDRIDALESQRTARTAYVVESVENTPRPVFDPRDKETALEAPAAPLRLAPPAARDKRTAPPRAASPRPARPGAPRRLWPDAV